MKSSVVAVCATVLGVLRNCTKACSSPLVLVGEMLDEAHRLEPGDGGDIGITAPGGELVDGVAVVGQRVR